MMNITLRKLNKEYVHIVVHVSSQIMPEWRLHLISHQAIGGWRRQVQCCPEVSRLLAADCRFTSPDQLHLKRYVLLAVI